MMSVAVAPDFTDQAPSKTVDLGLRTGWRALGEGLEAGDYGEKNMRISIFAIAAWFTLFSLAANAVSLGEITVRSALNEPLVAEIELVAEPPVDLATVRVSLAPAEAFTRAGIAREPILTQLEFAAITGPDGRPRIVVSSRQAMREPLLHFVVELVGEQARVQRSYTIFLDPPAP